MLSWSRSLCASTSGELPSSLTRDSPLSSFSRTSAAERRGFSSSRSSRRMVASAPPSSKRSPTIIHALKPAQSTRSGRAPYFSSAFAMGRCIPAEAKCSAVAPLLSETLGLARPSSSFFTVFRSPFFTMSISAVMPCRPLSFGFALSPRLSFALMNLPDRSFSAPSGVRVPTIGDAKARSRTVAVMLKLDMLFRAPRVSPPNFFCISASMM
mmetsp:Transcript_28603/g.81790  ORF Transcript_28603/g.81790 Transcript_28603/m.81790 type:complete len:211 (+) Transcript_28603:857-1489(+)